MNLDQLRAVQAREREKDGLQDLRPSFYQDVAEYLSELEAERRDLAADAEDPFGSSAVSQLTDEIETGREIVSKIYERRMGKIVKQASLAAAGLEADDEGLSEEEADLFADLVERIETNKKRVLEGLETDEVPIDLEHGSPPGTGTDGADEPTRPPQDAPTETPSDATDTDDALERVTVRIMQSVGPIVGVDDREYELQVDDVVQLPAANATPLLEQSAAERVESNRPD